MACHAGVSGGASTMMHSFRRMHSPPLVAQKWSFEMNAQRASLRCTAIVGRGRFDRISKSFQSRASIVERRSDGGGKISRHAVSRQKFFQPRQFVGRGTHEVDPRSAVHVNIEKTRRENGIAEVDQRAASNFTLSARGNIHDFSVFRNQQRVLNLFERSVEAASGERGSHGRRAAKSLS